MIYITYRKSFFENGLIVKNVWNVKCNNVEERYIEFIKIKAKEINVVINPQLFNLMNWQNFNNHLSIGEYGNKKKQWNKILRIWNIDYFIKEILKGKKLNYKNLYK